MTIVVSILTALMIAACGGNSTPAQETSDKPAAETTDVKEETEAEAVQDEKQETEEVAGLESAEVVEGKIEALAFVKYWRIKDGKLDMILFQESVIFTVLITWKAIFLTGKMQT